jgi:translocator protein
MQTEILRMNSWGALTICLAVCYGAAWSGSVFTRPNLPGWYAGLRKPAWSPPNYVFAPAWTALYTLMGVAAWLVWQQAARRSLAVSVPLAWFTEQLVLNVVWSALFFARRNPGAAFGEIILLWCAILGAAVAFRPFSALASALLVPYLLWVGFAAALNCSIWRLNRP